MSSILIKNIEMPKERESFTVTIKYNGLVFDTETGIQVAEAQEIPPHGKLGDLDKLVDRLTDMEWGTREQNPPDDTFVNGIICGLNSAISEIRYYTPTIIEAELPVHHGTFAATSKEEAIRRLTGEDKT